MFMWSFGPLALLVVELLLPGLRIGGLSVLFWPGGSRRHACDTQIRPDPEGPSTNISDTSARKYPYRGPFQAKGYHIGVLGPSGIRPEPWEDPKNGSTLRLDNLHHTSMRVQNWGICTRLILYYTILYYILYKITLSSIWGPLLDPPRALAETPRTRLQKPSGALPRPRPNTVWSSRHKPINGGPIVGTRPTLRIK